MRLMVQYNGMSNLLIVAKKAIETPKALEDLQAAFVLLNTGKASLMGYVHRVYFDEGGN